MEFWARLTVALAGLMGTAGVALAAAGAHVGGGDLARTAAEFLLIHAAVVLGIGTSVLAGLKPGAFWIVSSIVLALGTILFGADLGLIAFYDSRPLPFVAPFGGVMMIAGWLMLAVGAVVRTRNSKMTS